MITPLSRGQSVESITEYMKSVVSQFVDGYNVIDTPALLAETYKELGSIDAGAIPTEYELAIIAVEVWYKEQ